MVCQGCLSKTPDKKNKEQQFFDFDRVIYFKTKIDDNTAHALAIDRNLSDDENFYSGILSGDFPLDIQTVDTNRMIKVSYTKRNLDQAALKGLREIFSIKNPTSEIITMTCLPVYRDVLVFAKANKISGLAKICFGCHQYHFLGQLVTTESFGTDSDYTRLENVLKD